MTDIVERLMERAEIARAEGNATAISDAYHFSEAADEIERLRAALLEIASMPTCPGAERERLIHVARAALGEER